MLAQFVVDDVSVDSTASGTLRWALLQANALLNTQDEIVFDASLFAGGVTPVITLNSAINVNEPVWIHSDYGLVYIVNGSTVESGLILHPSLSQGISEDFEISDLVFQDFTYGIRINDTGGTPNATVEGVNIIGNGFLYNERGVYFEDALIPFEIADNVIVGSDEGGTSVAGICIQNGTTQTNSFETSIHDNVIVNYEDYGIAIVGGTGETKIQNLAIVDNRIGEYSDGTPLGNGFGIYFSGGEVENGFIGAGENGGLEGNRIVNNGTGILIIYTDDIEIKKNWFESNEGEAISLVNEANDHEIEQNVFLYNGLSTRYNRKLWMRS